MEKSVQIHIKSMVDDGLRNIPPIAPPAAVQNAAEGIQRSLMEYLLAQHEEMTLALRKEVRHIFPPLSVNTADLWQWRLPWLRQMVVLFLALIVARALWQGLGLSFAVEGLCMLISTAMCIWLVLYMDGLFQRLGDTLPSSQGRSIKPHVYIENIRVGKGFCARLSHKCSQLFMGLSILWSMPKVLRIVPVGYFFSRHHILRLVGFLWAFVLILAIIRDFIVGRALLDHWLMGLRALLEDGNFWILLRSFYGFWFWLGSFLLLAAWPRTLQVGIARKRLQAEALAWYARSAQIIDMLMRNTPPSAADERRLHAVGQRIYSFARELNNEQGKWLIQQVRDLGLEFDTIEDVLYWQESLREEYEMLGYIQEGDRCFVDKAPEYRDGTLLQKGLVRKVRI